MLTRKQSVNPAFIYSNEVKQICQGIFRRFNLNAFSYSKIYRDGSRAELWTDAKSLNHSFFLKQYIRQIYTPDLFNKQKFILYDVIVNSFPSEIKELIQNQLKDQRELFNYTNCLFLVEYHPQYTEYFAFYSPKSHAFAINSYLNNRDQLGHFCKYFRRRASQLIQDADKQKLISPWRDKDTGMILPNHNQVLANKDSLFTAADTQGINTLTPRQTEIADLLCEGISTKQIASILFISKRTVEKHLENIKMKIGCHNSYQLIKYWNTYRS